jgi:hypothetical protein
MAESYISEAAARVASLQKFINETVKPPSEIAASSNEPVIYMAMVRGTRGYIEKVAHQVNGCYSSGWYDSCAVMLRRLLETLIIECYETHKIDDRIKDRSGNYLFLKDLVEQILAEKTWTLGRAVRAALPKLKDLGDKSAHSRRFNAHREDIDRLLKDLRDAIQELVSLARLK